MNDEREMIEPQWDGEDSADVMRRAERVDFALRIAQSLGAAGQARPLAIAFQETVSRVLPPGDGSGPAA